jgi:hypothetical protein
VAFRLFGYRFVFLEQAVVGDRGPGQPETVQHQGHVRIVAAVQHVVDQKDADLRVVDHFCDRKGLFRSRSGQGSARMPPNLNSRVMIMDALNSQTFALQRQVDQQAESKVE